MLSLDIKVRSSVIAAVARVILIDNVLPVTADPEIAPEGRDLAEGYVYALNG